MLQVFTRELTFAETRFLREDIINLQRQRDRRERVLRLLRAVVLFALLAAICLSPWITSPPIAVIHASLIVVFLLSGACARGMDAEMRGATKQIDAIGVALSQNLATVIHCQASEVAVLESGETARRLYCLQTSPSQLLFLDDDGLGPGFPNTDFTLVRVAGKGGQVVLGASVCEGRVLAPAWAIAMSAGKALALPPDLTVAPGRLQSPEALLAGLRAPPGRHAWRPVYG